MRGIKIIRNIESVLKVIGAVLILQGIKKIDSQCVQQGEVCQYKNRLYYYEQQQYQLIANATANNIIRLFVNGQIVSLDDEWVQGGITGDCQQLGISFRISDFKNNTLNFYGITGNGSVVDISPTEESQLTNEYKNNTITVISNVNTPNQQNTSVTTIPVETGDASGVLGGDRTEVPVPEFTPVDEGTVLVPGLVPGTVPGLVEGIVPTPSVGAEEMLVPGTVPGEVQVPGTASAAGEGGKPPTTIPGQVPDQVQSPVQRQVPGLVPGQVPGLVPGLVASPNFGSVVVQSPRTRGIPVDQLGNLSFGINQQGVIQVTSNNTSETINQTLQEINNNTNVTTNTVLNNSGNTENTNSGTQNQVQGTIVEQNTTIGQSQQQIQNIEVNQNGTMNTINQNNATMMQNGTVLGVRRPGNGILSPPPAVLGAPPSVFGAPPSIFGAPPSVFGRFSPPPVYGIAVYPSSVLPVVQRKLLRMPRLLKGIEKDYGKQYEKYNCENDEQCIDCMEGHCYECENGYYMLNNESPCVLCETIQGCQRCQNYLGCTRCEEGYTLLQGTESYNRNICI